MSAVGWLRERRLEEVVLVVVLVGCFGPYVAGGLRTEQVVVYPIGGVVALQLLRSARAAVVGVVGVAAVWALYALVATLALFVPPAAVGGWGTGSTLSGLDNVWLPLPALAIGLWLCVRSDDPGRTLGVALGWIVGLMLANTLAVVLQIAGVSWRLWWSASGVDWTVAENSETHLRYGGLLNQPVESGFLYSIALIAAIELPWRRRWLMAACLAVLTFGGFCSVSKIFLLVGLPGALLLLAFKSPYPRRALAALGLAFVAILSVALVGIPGVWGGSYQLRQAVPHNSQSWVSSLTASRFGGGSTLEPVVHAVWQATPMVGVGASGLDVPYDNGWLEAFVMAGLVGVACYTAVLGLGLARSIRLGPGRGRTVLAAVVVLSTVASAGFPALTANRCATVVWLLIGLTWTRTERGPMGRELVDLRTG